MQLHTLASLVSLHVAFLCELLAAIAADVLFDAVMKLLVSEKIAALRCLLVAAGKLAKEHCYYLLLVWIEPFSLDARANDLHMNGLLCDWNLSIVAILPEVLNLKDRVHG